MKKLLLILLIVFGHQLMAQKLGFEKELTVNNKEFITSKKIRKNGLTLDNKDNINLKSEYKLFILREAKYDREKLSKVFLDVFSTDRIVELQEKTNNGNPAMGMTWHIDRSGNVCSVTYRLLADTHIKLEEFSELEDKIKENIKATDFLVDGMEQLDYYSLTFHVKLSKILDGSFVR